MPQGFGTIPGFDFDQGVEAAEFPTQQENFDDLRKIRERYVLPTYQAEIPFDLAAGASSRTDYSQTIHNAVIINVTQGTLDLWFGDYSTQANLPLVPHLRVPAGAPVQFVLPPGGRVYTLGNAATAAVNAQGYFIPMAV